MRSANVSAKLPSDSPCELGLVLLRQWRLAVRLVMVLMLLHGYSRVSVAELFGYHPRTVRRWFRRYQREGVTGLRDRPRSGRPRLGGPRLGERIAALLAEPRAWTVSRLWRRLRPAMSMRTMHRRVCEVANWRRPRLVAKGDPEAESKLEALRSEIEKLPAGAVILAEDETHLNLLPWVRSTWILKGLRQVVMTPGQNQRRTIFGAIELTTGRWLYRIAPKATSAYFIGFLEQVLNAYPGVPAIAIMLDNVISHQSRAVRSWLKEHPQVLLLYGARYCPHHNPVERIWAALKAYLANSPTQTMAARLRQAHAFFRGRTAQQMLVTASPFRSPWLPEAWGQNFCEAA
jgi:transposase